MDLPLELIFKITSILASDSHSLRTCSLVCKSWSKPFQHQLFSSFTISSESPSLYTFLEFIHESPDIISAIKHLVVKHSGKQWDTHLTQVLHALPPLKSLHLTSSLPWSKISPPKPSLSLLPLFTSETLTELTLHSILSLPHTVLIECIALQSLSLVCVGFSLLPLVNALREKAEGTALGLRPQREHTLTPLRFLRISHLFGPAASLFSSWLALTSPTHHHHHHHYSTVANNTFSIASLSELAVEPVIISSSSSNNNHNPTHQGCSSTLIAQLRLIAHAPELRALHLCSIDHTITSLDGNNDNNNNNNNNTGAAVGDDDEEEEGLDSLLFLFPPPPHPISTPTSTSNADVDVDEALHTRSSLTNLQHITFNFTVSENIFHFPTTIAQLLYALSNSDSGGDGGGGHDRARRRHRPFGNNPSPLGNLRTITVQIPWLVGTEIIVKSEGWDVLDSMMSAISMRAAVGVDRDQYPQHDDERSHAQHHAHGSETLEEFILHVGLFDGEADGDLPTVMTPALDVLRRKLPKCGERSGVRMRCVRMKVL